MNQATEKKNRHRIFLSCLEKYEITNTQDT